MTLKEIKQAVDSNINVFWSSLLYKVVKDNNNNLLIKCSSNGFCIGLTTPQGDLNGNENDFFTKKL